MVPSCSCWRLQDSGGTQHEVRTDGSYSVKIAFIAPFVAILALGIIIHAPRIPMNEMTARDGLYAAVGGLAGLWNLGRLGALDADSSVRLPILVGLSLAALCFAGVEIWKLTKN